MPRHDRHDMRPHDPSRGRVRAALFERNDEGGCLGGGLVIRQTGLPISLNNMHEPYVRFKSVA